MIEHFKATMKDAYGDDICVKRIGDVISLNLKDSARKDSNGQRPAQATVILSPEMVRSLAKLLNTFAGFVEEDMQE